MVEDKMVVRIYCHRCKSYELHVFNSIGTFNCLNCRVHGYSTFRMLMATCSIDDVPEKLPKDLTPPP